MRKDGKRTDPEKAVAAFVPQAQAPVKWAKLHRDANFFEVRQDGGHQRRTSLAARCRISAEKTIGILSGK